MKYELMKAFSNDRFRQVTGVNIATFEVMVDVLRHAIDSRVKGTYNLTQVIYTPPLCLYYTFSANQCQDFF